MKGQGGGHLLAAGLFPALQVGQQQARLQVGQPRRHHQIIGGQLQVGAPGADDEGQVLLGQLQDGDLRQVHLLVAGQGQKQVDGTLEAVDVDDEADAGIDVHPVHRVLEVVPVVHQFLK